MVLLFTSLKFYNCEFSWMDLCLVCEYEVIILPDLEVISY